jgi:membrane-bound ClpP family serine protease
VSYGGIGTGKRGSLIMCHVILLSPVLALPLFFFLPFGTALPTYLTIVLGSGFVYFKIVTAMKSKVETGIEAMTDEEAVVVEEINPEGKVRFGNEIWSAATRDKRFVKGKKVKICAIDGIKVIVDEPYNMSD